MPSSRDIAQRAEDRLQGLYDSIQQGLPIDFEREALLDSLDSVQFSQAAAREAEDLQRQSDESTFAYLRELSQTEFGPPVG